MHNLITFGAQHMGVSNSPPCKPFDILCRLVLNGLKQGVYSEWAQNNIIQVSINIAHLFVSVSYSLFLRLNTSETQPG